ncbi:uncharacterized protein LOC128983105 isoform X2 [Macrosteles quadrilineatus]|nr:uncharacterized protein LOC128983105 isoform X2 [Macrosteles quadrilineatus]XP_054258241.1 uncharacterized protein LOC128983105 isoform X2 [Macrosteles quadrilineatus]
MTTIVLSSEDEDDCIIIGEQVNIQPLQAVYIVEDESKLNLLAEDGPENSSNQLEDTSINIDIEEASIHILPKTLTNLQSAVAGASELSRDAITNNVETDHYPTSFYEDDTCDKDTFDGFINKSVEENSDKSDIKQNHNQGLKSLAEALTVVQSLNESLEKRNNENLFSMTIDEKLKTNFKTDSVNNNNEINHILEPAEVVERRQSSDNMENNPNTKLCLKNRVTLLEDNHEKQPYNREPYEDQTKEITGTSELEYLTHSKPTKKKIGRLRKPISLISENIHSVSSLCSQTRLESATGSNPNKKKRGRKLGWRKYPVDQKVCDEQICKSRSTSTKTTSYNLTPINQISAFTDSSLCSQSRLGSASESTPNKKKRGRKLGWRKYPVDQKFCDEQISKSKSTSTKTTSDTLTPNEQLSENIPAGPSLCSQTLLGSATESNPSKKKRGRKLGWRKYPVDQKLCDEQISKSKSTSTKTTSDTLTPNEQLSENIPAGPSLCSQTLLGSATESNPSKKKRGRKLGWSKYSVDQNVCDEQIYKSKSTFTKTTPDTLLNIDQSSINTDLDLISLNIVPQHDINKCSKNPRIEKNIKQRLPIINTPPSITDSADQTSLIPNEMLPLYYNRIVDPNIIILINKLAEILDVTMKEAEQCSIRIATARKDSCDLSRENKITAAKARLKMFIILHRISFCAIFDDTLTNLFLTENMTDQHADLLLVLFLKIFLRVTTLTPKYLDSLSLARWSFTSLLHEYVSTVTPPISRILHETFWQSKNNFERSCLDILDSFLKDIPDQIDSVSTPKGKSDVATLQTIRTKSVSKGLDDVLETLPATNNKSVEVSVIVKNSNHNVQEHHQSQNGERKLFLLSQNMDLNSTSSIHFEKLTAKLKDKIVDYSSSSTSVSNGHCKEFSDTCNQIIDANNVLLNHQNRQTTLGGLEFNPQVVREENTVVSNIGVKRKHVDAEKHVLQKPNASKNFQSSSKSVCVQQPALDVQSSNPISFSLQRTPYSKLQTKGQDINPSNQELIYSNKYSECNRVPSNHTIHCLNMPNTFNYAVSQSQTTQTSSINQATRSSAFTSTNNMPTTAHLNGSFDSTDKMRTLPLQRHQYNSQYYNTYQTVGQQRPDFNQAQSYPFVYGQNFSYQRYMHPHYFPYDRSANQQTNSWPDALTLRHQYASDFSSLYSSTPGELNKAQGSYGINHFTTMPDNSSTYHQVQSIHGNPRVTINNYNINNFVPPTVPDHISQNLKSDAFDRSPNHFTTSYGTM